MAHTEQHIEAEIGSQEAFEQMVKERLRYAVRVALISVLEEEVTACIGAQPYERNEQRHDYRNGHYSRNLDTCMRQADGTYFTVIYNNEGCKMPILAVVGIAESGEREVLAFGIGDRENEQAWKDRLDNL